MLVIFSSSYVLNFLYSLCFLFHLVLHLGCVCYKTCHTQHYRLAMHSHRLCLCQFNINTIYHNASQSGNNKYSMANTVSAIIIICSLLVHVCWILFTHQHLLTSTSGMWLRLITSIGTIDLECNISVCIHFYGTVSI